ncbi:hypothetical protein P175DRAFT_0504003 [Aspergillus ochraceoroseus IBT 24754]|uniref:Nucleic acid-binding protein n=1 Tax=Aspergillus ochraceoroseus IBT 24754 TaxID=1392256 RepID=A0A2T5LPA7_9EURO|nr:uncharacterized protein P175DRAFT_0504003 [Aspergillus ochraceoroseus IBT 24754]PTU18113.1 hypothetical protein P175DRAFT_0504003 [Aspergillus ochraceoroseus IBT 24754]
MSPTHIFRAMQPLRSSIIRRTTTTSSTAELASLYSTRPAFIPRRSLSSTPSPASELQEQQQQPQPQPQQQQTTLPSTTTATTLPSLRNYPYSLKTGTVVSVGHMDRTVRVDHRHTMWDSYLRKSYPKITTYLVSDPQNSLREGDVIEFSSGFPKSRRVRHVVERIIAPFGESIEGRPAVLSREERDALRAQKRAAKATRREERRGEEEEEVQMQGQGQIHGHEHVGRIRRLVLERTTSTQA